MKIKEFELLMTEIKEVKQDLKEVRQVDVPGVHTRIAVMEEKMAELRNKVTKEADRKAKIYGGVGGAVALMFSLLVEHFKH